MYISLARKYRPKRFADVAVQSHVSNTLKGAIARGRVAHGYLMCGPRGVGKTTLARVLAMALNCENKAPDGEPCGVCTSCQRIRTGSTSHDEVEIGAALALALGDETGGLAELSERTREERGARAGQLAPGDLLRMLSAITELEPRFRRSGQQQMLVETMLVRFALMDRTVSLEEVLRGLGPESGGGGDVDVHAAPRPAPRAPAL